MANQANIKAVISAEDRASKVLNKFGTHIASVSKKMAIGIGVAAGAATAFGVAAVKAYSEAQDEAAQTNAVLKSTGRAAGVTAGQVTKLATSLQKVTKFSDEEIRSGENLLLTFTKIGKDIFPQATETMLDMSQALGQDMKSSAVQLGKALQDPILGVSALRRVGVNFSQKQKDVIEKLVKTGKAAEAQKLILKELQVEFGGSARAAGTTFAGKLTILKNSLNDVQETIGFVIVDAIQPFIAAAAEFVAKIDWEETIDKSIFAIKDLWHKYIVPITSAIASLAKTIGSYLLPKFEVLWNSVSQKLLPSLKELWEKVLKPLVPLIGTSLVIALGLAIDALNILITISAPLISFLAEHQEIVWGLVAAYGAFKLALMITGAIAAVQGAIATLGSGMGLATLKAIGLKNVLLSMALPGIGTFALIAGAAVIAASVIVKAGNRTKKAWTDAQTAIQGASTSDQSVIQRLKAMSKAPYSKETIARSKATLQKLADTGNFASGGFTGRGGSNEIAGIVHKGEYVLPQNQVNQSTGMPKGGGTVNITVQAGAFMGSRQDARKYAKMIMEAYQEVMGPRGRMA